MNPEDKEAALNIKLDHKTILNMITSKSRILDLGCGDGSLLEILIKEKHCKGTGIEIDEKEIYKCIAKGLSVSHGDIDSGLTDYSSSRFDYIILNGSLQQVLNPQKVILESLRVGTKVIVGIPNFCNIKARIQIFFRGTVPVTAELPCQWDNTPNLRFLSLKDFRHFCKRNNIKILKETGLSKNKLIPFRPNLFANMGIFLLSK